MTGREVHRDVVPLVLHVIPTAVARGAQREARALREHLDAPGVRSHLLLNLFEGPTEIDVDLSLDHPGGDQPAVGFDPRLALRLRRAVARMQPRVVVAHGGDSLKYVVPATWGRRTKVVYYATGTFGGGGRFGRLALWRRLVRGADVVPCEGKEVLDECASVLGVPRGHLLLVPNGRDPEEFHPLDAGEAATGTDPSDRHRSDPLVIFVGALTDGKGIDLYVKVISALRHSGIELRALVLGDGPMLNAIAQSAEDAGVELLGSRPDVAQLLRRAAVMVFPSRPTGEGIPGVLIEAGLSGVPVVATKVPGASTVVDDGSTGVLVDVDDLESMVEAVTRLLTDEGSRSAMGKAARARCSQLFTVDVVVSSWLSFLEPMIGPG